MFLRFDGLTVALAGRMLMMYSGTGSAIGVRACIHWTLDPLHPRTRAREIPGVQRPEPWTLDPVPCTLASGACPLVPVRVLRMCAPCGVVYRNLSPLTPMSISRNERFLSDGPLEEPPLLFGSLCSLGSPFLGSSFLGG